MHRTPHPARRHSALVVVLLTATVLFRAWFFLHYDESYFDSDQAIVGLMAKHLVEGRARPLFFYGQQYMLAVEAWVMAPIFAVLGPTVFALRLTMILLNVVTAVTLWWLLVRDALLDRWLAALAVTPFALAPFVTAAHLIEAQGGNIEEFLWVLVVWVLRARPVPLGVALAVAFLNREFTIYAVPALLLVQLVEVRGRAGALVRPWLVTLAIFALVFAGINALKPYADLLGPGSAGIRPDAGAADNVMGLLERVNVNAGAIPARARAMAGVYLPMMLGLFPFRPSLIGIGSFAHVGWPELLPILALFTAIVIAWLAWDLARKPGADGAAFPAYLALVGLQAAIVYPLTRDLSMFTFRYGLLALFLPVALGALTLQAARPMLLRGLGALTLALMASASLVDHASVLQQARVEPPPPRLVPLAAHLEARGIHVARAGYWRAYVLSFRTRERVKVASTDFQRIREYQLLADEGGAETVDIREQSCEGRVEIEVVDGWHLCK